LVSGSNGNVVGLDELMKGDWEPFYGAMYLSLDGVNSDNMHEKVRLVLGCSTRVRKFHPSYCPDE